MPILTVKQAKEILQLTDTDEYDETLSVLIPIVQNHVIFNILHKSFSSQKVWLMSNTISFQSSTNKILDSAGKFLSEGRFTSGIDIWVTGSLFNDGIYFVKEALASSLEINFEHSIRNDFIEEPNTDKKETIFIRHLMLDSQDDLKVPTARLLFYMMQQEGIKGIKSESVLTYSVQYLNEIPPDIRNMFNNIRSVSW